ncbi:Imm8 family immunity protein [Parasedimentitalea huanghaiensis]|uniref:Uncharacterized protein n=1 Tax=Parasedimentitalea huanghaiensis TaxID=2682100 RepID=A0A6L6WLR9_9RHOB|nr:Imm8 family immunity protein [Zongyanglinia huanghaiensis]MVO18158.1 hypothetical protein [Zongyanglinia huanghaiensis]
MNAVLKKLHVFDTHMTYFFPEDVRYFDGFLEAEIGPASSEEWSRFSAIVCTPSWFAQNIVTRGKQDPTHATFYKASFGTHHLFVHEYDEDIIRKAIEDLVSVHGQGDWSKAAMRLSRHLAWEFDDYDPTEK